MCCFRLQCVCGWRGWRGLRRIAEHCQQTERAARLCGGWLRCLLHHSGQPSHIHLWNCNIQWVCVTWHMTLVRELLQLIYSNFKLMCLCFASTGCPLIYVNGFTSPGGHVSYALHKVFMFNICSSAHQGCIYLIENTVQTVILWNIIAL